MHDGCMADVVNGVMRPEPTVVVAVVMFVTVTVASSTLFLVMPGVVSVAVEFVETLDVVRLVVVAVVAIVHLLPHGNLCPLIGN